MIHRSPVVCGCSSKGKDNVFSIQSAPLSNTVIKIKNRNKVGTGTAALDMRRPFCLKAPYMHSYRGLFCLIKHWLLLANMVSTEPKVWKDEKRQGKGR